MATIVRRKGKRGITWRAMVRVKGEAATRTFKDKTEAEAWANRIEGNFDRLKADGHFEAAKHTVAGAHAEFAAASEYDEDLVYGRDKQRHLEYWDSVIGNVKLSDLTPSLIENELKKLRRRKGRTSATVNRYRTSLSSLITVCNKWNWMRTHPVRQTQFKTEPEGKKRYLTEDERERLLAECQGINSEGLYEIVLLGLSTGARLGELQNLTWDRVDLESNTIRLIHTKTKKERSVPLAGPVLKVMKQWAKVRHIDSDLVFPGIRDPQRPHNYRGAFERACTRAELWSKAQLIEQGMDKRDAALNGFSFYCLRHSVGAELTRHSVPAQTIQKILGHSSPVVTARYAHVDLAASREAMERIHGHK